MSHMKLFVGWSAIVCGVEFEDEDATVLLQTKIVQEHMHHSVGNFLYDSDGAQIHNYDEVWEIPDVDSCWDWYKCSYKTEAEVQAACSEKKECRGYFAHNVQKYVTRTPIIEYALLNKRSVFSKLVYGFGTPSPNVLHVFAKDAASDLVKLGVSKAKYDYTGGSCRSCALFGGKYLTEEDAQAACNFFGANCIGYFDRTYGYFLVGFGFKRSKFGSLMLKSRVVIEPTKAGATPAAKKAAKKAAKAEKKAAGAEKKAAKAAKTAAVKRASLFLCQNGVTSTRVDWCQCSLDGAC